MIILSIDSGLERTGYAFFDKDKINKKSFYITSGLIKTSPKLSIEKRIHHICLHLNLFIKQYKPQKVILERLFFFKNAKTVISVSQAQGAVLYIASQHNIPVFFLTPLQIKQIVTGYGNADKKSVAKMVHLLLNLKNNIKQDDVIDAIACGLAYCYTNETLLS